MARFLTGIILFVVIWGGIMWMIWPLLNRLDRKHADWDIRDIDG